MKCHCGDEFVRAGEIGETLVGYFSPPGHDHNDNCLIGTFYCKNGHSSVISKRRRCTVCDWIGKDECFCHTGKKVDEWPMVVE